MSDKMRELFDQVADTLVQGVTPVPVTGEDGKEVKILPSPAMVSAAITFLKNNNITASQENEKLVALTKQLEARKARRTPVTQRALEAAREDFDASLGEGIMQ